MNRTLPLLATANFAAGSAGMIIAGVLQLIAADLSWSPAQAGHLITLYALGFAVGAPLLGAALGSWCRKKVVVLGLSLVALGSFGTAASSATPWLEVSRLMVACGAAMTVPSVSAIAAFLYPNERPRALASVLMGLTVAIVLGVPIGTLVAGYWGWHAPLFGAGALAASAALAIKLLLPGGIVVPPVPLASWRRLLANPRTYPLLGPSLIVVASTFSLYAYIAPFLGEMLGIGPKQLSLLLSWYGVASLLASVVLGRLSARLGAHQLLQFSLVGLALTLAVTRFIENSVSLAVVTFAAWAVFGSFFGTLQQARVVEAEPASGTALLALNTSAIFAGQAIGTLLGGWVIAEAGLRALPWIGAVIAALGLMLVVATRNLRLNRAAV